MKQILREKEEINSIPFDQIVWFENGKEIEINPKALADWKFIGMSNVLFIEDDFHLSEGLEDVTD